MSRQDKKPIGSMWRPVRPRAYTTEERRTRSRAMLDLAHRVAESIRDGAIKPATTDIRAVINRAVRDDERLRLLGMSDLDVHRVLNATLSLISSRSRPGGRQIR